MASKMQTRKKKDISYERQECYKILKWSYSQIKEAILKDNLFCGYIVTHC